MRKRKQQAKLHDDQCRAAYHASPYAAWGEDAFLAELQLLKQGKPSRIDFDEAFYLANNPDVRAAVDAGSLVCGYAHYLTIGHTEIRHSSTQALQRLLNITPGISENILFYPQHAFAHARYSALALGEAMAGRSAVILISNLNRDLFFAGYSAFFADIATIADQFAEITVLVREGVPQPELLAPYAAHIRVLGPTQANEIIATPDMIFCFDSETFFQAHEMFNLPERTVYYCQDHEAGFFPYGSMHVRALQAVKRARHLVLSTSLLRDFLQHEGLIATPSVHITSPAIQPFPVLAQPSRKLFFYFRPEKFNTRNMPETIATLAKDFAQRHHGYTLYLIGSVGTNYSYTVNGTDILVASKLPREQYQALMGECDAVVSLIYSAHPGVIAYQAAASGIPTVTNSFANRSKAYLARMSDNIVPYDPVEDDLLACLEQALKLPKGRPDFKPELYSAPQADSFRDYVVGLLG